MGTPSLPGGPFQGSHDQEDFSFLPQQNNVNPNQFWQDPLVWEQLVVPTTFGQHAASPWSDYTSPDGPPVSSTDEQVMCQPPPFTFMIPPSNPVKLESPGTTSEPSLTPGTRPPPDHTIPGPTLRTIRQKSPQPPQPASVFRHYPPLPPRKRQPRARHQKPSNPEEGEASRARSLEKNRKAAEKCRKKKKDNEMDLEEYKVGLEEQNSYLQTEYDRLLEEASDIRARLMEHAGCRDGNIDQWIANEAKRYVLQRSDQYDEMLASLGPVSDLARRLGDKSRCLNACCRISSTGESSTPSSPQRDGAVQPVTSSDSPAVSHGNTQLSFVGSGINPNLTSTAPYDESQLALSLDPGDSIIFQGSFQ